MRYWASYPAALYYASSIDNLHSTYCLDLKYEAHKSWESNNDILLPRNSHNTEYIASKSELNYIAWKCVNDILGKIDVMSVTDFDKVWFWDRDMSKKNEDHKKWIILGTFFLAQEMPWIESLSGSTQDIFSFSQLKEAGELWNQSDPQSYSGCRSWAKDELSAQKNPPSDLLVNDCVNKAQKYLILSATKFSKMF